MPLEDRQFTSVEACARRSLPDGVFGIIPGSSTTTLRGRTSTSANTSCATCRSMRRTSSADAYSLDSTATAKDSRECPASSRTATAQPGRTPTTRVDGALDVGRINVLAGHDDDVLEPATHHHAAGFGEIAQVAGVVPALFILGGDEATHRGVAPGHRFTADLDDADAARRQEAAVLVDDRVPQCR